VTPAEAAAQFANEDGTRCPDCGLPFASTSPTGTERDDPAWCWTLHGCRSPLAREALRVLAREYLRQHRHDAEIAEMAARILGAGLGDAVRAYLDERPAASDERALDRADAVCRACRGPVDGAPVATCADPDCGAQMAVTP
jgi:hypothetical protein